MAEPIKPPAASDSRLRTGDEGSGLLPRRVIFANPERSIVRISRDGTRIAFRAPIDGVLNLWVAPIDQIDNARPMTAVSDRSAATTMQLASLHGQNAKNSR